MLRIHNHGDVGEVVNVVRPRQVEHARPDLPEGPAEPVEPHDRCNCAKEHRVRHEIHRLLRLRIPDHDVVGPGGGAANEQLPR
eukprot:1394344-Lingulodinium_polyedra.AAC.1